MLITGLALPEVLASSNMNKIIQPGATVQVNEPLEPKLIFVITTIR